MNETIEGQMNLFDVVPEESKKAVIPRIEPRVNNTKKLTLDTLRPCDCGYTGRKFVHYTGCGIGGMNGERMEYSKYVFSIFCPKCYRSASDNLGWYSYQADIQQAMRDWQENPLQEATIFAEELYKRSANDMDYTIHRWSEFVGE